MKKSLLGVLQKLGRVLLWPFLQSNFRRVMGRTNERAMQADIRKPKDPSPTDQIRGEGFLCRVGRAVLKY